MREPGQGEILAQKIISDFRAEFGENHLILANYAAFPLVLTPELLYFIREKLVSPEVKVPPLAVARVLLSPMFQEIDDEVYEILLPIREQLIKSFSVQRLTYLGKFLLNYLETKPSNNSHQERQNLIALAYLKPAETAQKLAVKLTESMAEKNISEILKWSKVVSALSSPLRNAGFNNLLVYNNSLLTAIVKKAPLPDPYPVIHQFKQAEGEALQKLALITAEGEPKEDPRKNPTLINFCKKFSLQLQTMTLEVTQIVIRKEEPEKTKQKELETLYVNTSGEANSRQQFTINYYEEFISCPILMVAIPPGEFIMGSQAKDLDYPDERPPHRVKIAPFFLSQTPITQAQWQAIAALPQEYLPLNPQPAEFRGEKLPVDGVSWQEAREFCARLSRYTGKNYRLPSEAEWEYSCRATPYPQKDTPFHYGETLTASLANYNSSSAYHKEPPSPYRRQPTPVGSFPPNAFGLYDMHGNVWEWCLDIWHDNYQGAPTQGESWDEENRQDILAPLPHVIRGGAWNSAPAFCRSGYRLFDTNLFRVGLRLARADDLHR